MLKDIPLTPRGSSDLPPSFSSQNDAGELRLNESDEHEQLLSFSPEHEYGYAQSSEQENLLGDDSGPAFLGDVSISSICFGVYKLSLKYSTFFPLFYL
jgi:hypothetical protein